jgi:hypothetical protein
MKWEYHYGGQAFYKYGAGSSVYSHSRRAIAGINAFPAIKALDLLALWPVLFYALVIVSAVALAFQLRPRQPTAPQHGAEPANPIAPISTRTEPRESDALKAEIDAAKKAGEDEVRKAGEERQWLQRFPFDAKPISARAGSVVFKLKLGERKIIAEGMTRLGV